MNRLCIFVIYDPERLLREETGYLLEKLGDVSDTIITAVNGGLCAEYMPRLRSLSTSVVIRENMGFDAGAYKDVLLPLLESGELSAYDELVLCNDTFFGPFYSFTDVFGAMDGISCDFWGMTRYLAQPEQNIAEHIQAYFLVFRRRVLSDASFRAFWESLIYPRDYDEAVLRFEIALSQTLFFCGFTGATYAEACGWQFHEDGNDYVRYPLELIRDARLPLLKKRALKDDVSDVTTLAPVMRHIKENTNYPVEWVYKHWLRLHGDCPAGKDVPPGMPYFTVADIEEFCGKYRRIFVCGCGKVASYVREYLDFRGITVEAFLVSERGASCLSDEAVFTDTVAFDEAPLDGDCGIIVALGKDDFSGLYQKLNAQVPLRNMLLPKDTRQVLMSQSCLPYIAGLICDQAIKSVLDAEGSLAENGFQPLAGGNLPQIDLLCPDSPGAMGRTAKVPLEEEGLYSWMVKQPDSHYDALVCLDYFLSHGPEDLISLLKRLEGCFRFLILSVPLPYPKEFTESVRSVLDALGEMQSIDCRTVKLFIINTSHKEKYKKMPDCVYIYGAGTYGKECYKNLLQTGHIIKAFVVTDKKGNPDSVFATSVIDRDTFLKSYDGERVFVAMKESFRGQVLDSLGKSGILNAIPYVPVVAAGTATDSNINQIAQECLKHERIYIYGAGIYAEKCFAFLSSAGIKVGAFVVTVRGDNPYYLHGIPVRAFPEMAEDERAAFYILALKPSFQESVIPLLEENGIDSFVPYIDLRKTDSYSAPFRSGEELAAFIRITGGTVYNEENMSGPGRPPKNRTVLLVSHELTITGAPLALLGMARVLRHAGREPVVISPADGKLRKELEKENITVIICDRILSSNMVARLTRLFGMVVCNTLLTAHAVRLLSDTGIPVLWWIHEPKAAYNSGMLRQIPKRLPGNIHVYCAGEYPRKVLEVHRRNICTKELLFSVPDLSQSKKDGLSSFKLLNPQGKKVFAVVGSLEARKGQSIFCDAIRLLPDKIRENSLFCIAGRDDIIDPATKSSIMSLTFDYPENVRIIKEIPRKEIPDFYGQTDCLVCSSVDEPMSITVIEAASLSKTIICSENAGAAVFLKKYGAGYVYGDNSPAALAGCMEKAFLDEGTEIQDEMRANARRLYEENFTEAIFRRSMESVLREMEEDSAVTGLPEGTADADAGGVDIIIPIYNAYEDLTACLASVFDNTDLHRHRLVLIDDNSTDRRVGELLDSMKRENVIVIRNQKNEGFSSNVNKGMSLSNKRDVLLLNSDTVVTENWLEKILSCAYSRDEIGTVTPLSNNATLASVPMFCGENGIPDGLDIDGMASLVERCSARIYPRVTVAVGFCMLIKRSVIDDIGMFDAQTFGRGYGEENDFCNRAEQAGYIHVLCDDTFIYHRGTGSFVSEEKQRLIAEHERILFERYPLQMQKNDLYVRTNPHQYIRDNLNVHVALANKRKNILYIIHTPLIKEHGGTARHVMDLRDGLRRNYNVFVAYRQGESINLSVYTADRSFEYSFYAGSDQPFFRFTNLRIRRILETVIDAFHIDLVHIHHLLSYSLDIFGIAKEKNIPVVFTTHDFFCISHSYNLLDSEGRYIDISKDTELWDARNKQYSYSGSLDVNGLWRKKFGEALAGTTVVCPSRSCMGIISSYYSSLRDIRVIPHGCRLAGAGKVRKQAPSGRPHVAFLGGAAFEKGSRILRDMLVSPGAEGYEWHLLGIIGDPELSRMDMPNLEKYGPYDVRDLPVILDEKSIDLIVLPSIWPETFSYTLSESLLCGIPVLGMNVGAIGERIRGSGCGWTVPYPSDAGQFLQKMREIFSEAGVYAAVKGRAMEYGERTVPDMCAEYASLYDGLISGESHWNMGYDAEFLLSGLLPGGPKGPDMFDRDIYADAPRAGTAELLADVRRYRQVYVYGAGGYGKRALGLLAGGGVRVPLVIVSDGAGNPASIGDAPVVPLGNFSCDRDASVIVVALKQVYADQVIPLLKERGLNYVNFLDYV